MTTHIYEYTHKLMIPKSMILLKAALMQLV